MDWREERAGFWQRCLKAYRNAMLKVAGKYSGSVIGAEDIVQDAVLAAPRRFDDIRDEAELGPLLLGITRNLGRQVAKKRGRRKALRDKHLVRDSGPRDPQALPDESDQRLDSVLRVARSLPESQREVLHQRLLGFSYKGIAARVEKSEGTVRSYFYWYGNDGLCAPETVEFDVWLDGDYVLKYADTSRITACTIAACAAHPRSVPYQ